MEWGAAQDKTNRDSSATPNAGRATTESAPCAGKAAADSDATTVPFAPNQRLTEGVPVTCLRAETTRIKMARCAIPNVGRATTESAPCAGKDARASEGTTAHFAQSRVLTAVVRDVRHAQDVQDVQDADGAVAPVAPDALRALRATAAIQSR